MRRLDNPVIENILQQEREALLEQALTRLGSKEREVFERCSGIYGQRETFKTIACEENRTSSLIRQRYFVTVKKIRRFIERKMSAEDNIRNTLPKEEINGLLDLTYTPEVRGRMREREMAQKSEYFSGGYNPYWAGEGWKWGAIC